MRIGLVCPYSFAVPGGVQNHVLGLARWLATQGHAVEVLGPDAVIEGPPGVGLTSCGRGRPWRANGSVARVSFGPTTGRAVARWLDRARPDVLHVHEPALPSAALLALARSDLPAVATFHSARPGTGLHELSGRLLTSVLDKIRVPIAVSAPAAALAHATLGREVQIIPNGLAIAQFGSVAGRPWRGGSRPRVVFLGRDEPRKGLDVFLRAVPELRRLDPAPDLVVATDTERPLPAGVRRICRPDDVTRDRLLAGADVYVAPHTGRESFGLVLIEALASGAAVVASDLPAFAAATAGGPDDAVRFFPVGDDQALAAAVDAALNAHIDPARARAVAAPYDWSRVGPRILDAYAQARGAFAAIA